jgi:hypothetical protein
MSKNELRAKAAELAKKLTLDLPADFERMNADALEVLVAELEAMAPEAASDGKPPAGSDAKDPVVEAASVAAGGGRFFVADRRSITSARGVLGPGSEVRPSDLTGLNNDGTKTPAALLASQNAQLDYLVSRGHLVKR